MKGLQIVLLTLEYFYGNRRTDEFVKTFKHYYN
nr:MAG TPA: hypothetical protein [Caudoviricetes sp.]